MQGCLATALLPRDQIADSLAKEIRWLPRDIDTTSHRLRLYMPPRPKKYRLITVFIEGDGQAWIDRVTPSDDPTPREPIGLELAVASDNPASAYIARPCQYTLEADRIRCHTAVWTHARYSETVLTATSEAIDHLKRQFQAQKVVLVGYSGGGTVAALVATRRNDIARLITLAANLDTDYWTRLHRVTPLVGSLNPADFGEELRDIPQLHFVGADDDIVPADVTRSFMQKIGRSVTGTVKIIDGADHTCCWADKWPQLLREIEPSR